jgi:hypothetical protein
VLLSPCSFSYWSIANELSSVVLNKPLPPTMVDPEGFQASQPPPLALMWAEPDPPPLFWSMNHV